MEGIIFIGLQASGKSSFYFEQLRDTHIRLNYDMLRTRNREKILFDACLRSKTPTVVDNTNPRVADRKCYIAGFKEHKFQIIGYYFQSKFDECFQRNTKRPKKTRVKEIGLRDVYSKLELPTYEEGFDELYYVSLEGDGFKVEGWKNEV